MDYRLSDIVMNLHYSCPPLCRRVDNQLDLPSVCVFVYVYAYACVCVHACVCVKAAGFQYNRV